MNVLNEGSDECTNKDIDYYNYYLNRIIKFTLTFTLMLIFTSILFNYNDTLSVTQTILILCTFVSVILYILDSYFPICIIKF